MPRFHAIVLAALAALFASTSAHASVILTANMTNAGEPGSVIPTLSTGGPRPASFGTATFVLNDAQTQMTMFATIFNIDVTGSQTTDTFDNLAAAHIHAGPNVFPANNPVVWGFFGMPDNDNNPDNLVVTPFATGVGGTFSSTWDQAEGQPGTNLTMQIPNILSEHAYINFHTTQFPGGEIRGTLVVPEPATVALLGIAAVGLFGFARRRTRAVV